jgi:hypothetical protein
MVSEANLDFWIKNNYNVLFRGKRGCGKTAMILEAFKRNNLRWLYFSTPTMDPYVDLIGVPKEKVIENGKSYLDFVRPKALEDDEVDAIFFDEYSRSSKKVRNATIELIQFSSINGKKFKNLKMVWAAINPDDDEDHKYDVEPLDPAQVDRFQVIIDVPYLPHVPYFRSKYGNNLADAAVSWWKELSKDQKNEVSPRRLDYTLDMYSKGGDIKHVLPPSVNTSKLLVELATGSISKKLKELHANKDNAAAKSFLAIENNYAACESYILKSKEYKEYFVPLLAEEKIIVLMNKDNYITDLIFNNYNSYKEIINNIAKSGSSWLSKEANRIVKQHVKAASAVTLTSNNYKYSLNSGYQVHFAAGVDLLTAKSQLLDMIDQSYKYVNQTTYHNISNYRTISQLLPQILDDKLSYSMIYILANLALSFQYSTVNKSASKLIPMLNHLFIYRIKNNLTLSISIDDVRRIMSKYQDKFLLDNIEVI